MVSNVSSETSSEHGVCATIELLVNWTLARNSPRVPVTASWLKVSVVERICDPVVVKLVAVPMVFPLALVNVMVPAQAGAAAVVLVAVEVAVAIFTTFTWAVSVLASPTGGKL